MEEILPKKVLAGTAIDSSLTSDLVNFVAVT